MSLSNVAVVALILALVILHEVDTGTAAPAPCSINAWEWEPVRSAKHKTEKPNLKKTKLQKLETIFQGFVPWQPWAMMTTTTEAPKHKTALDSLFEGLFPGYGDLIKFFMTSK